MLSGDGHHQNIRQLRSGLESPKPDSVVHQSSLQVDEDGTLKRSQTVIGPLYREFVLSKNSFQDDQILSSSIPSSSKPIPLPPVWCKIKIYRLTNLDLIAMTVCADFVLMLDWVDESVASRGAGARLETDHFSPYVRIHNATEEIVRPVDNALNRLQEKPKFPGHVKRTERYRCTLFIEGVQLSKYPFDSHDLKIVLKGDHIHLRSGKYCELNDKGKVSKRVTAAQGVCGDEICPRKDCNHSIDETDNSHLSGWEMLGFCKEDELVTRSTGDTLTISVTVKRNPFGLVMILIVPLVICIILSLSSFVLESTDLSDRLSITVTMLLAAAAFHQQARGHIPPNLPYTTVLDKYMLSTLFLFLMQAIIHVFISFLPLSSTMALTDIEKAIHERFNCQGFESAEVAELAGSESSTMPLSEPIVARRSVLGDSFSHRLSYFIVLMICATSFHVYKRSAKSNQHLDDEDDDDNQAGKSGKKISVLSSISRMVAKILKMKETSRRILLLSSKSIISATIYMMKMLVTFVVVLFIMFLGCHSVSPFRTNLNSAELLHFILWTPLDCLRASLLCLQGYCSGGLSNPYLCQKSFVSVASVIFSEQVLFEVMLFTIIVVHLALWIEYLI